MTSSGSAAPGWYPDPHNPAQLRYWDGAAWTEALAPAQGSPVDQRAAGQVAGQPPFAVSPQQPAGSGLGELGSWLSAVFSTLIASVGPVAVLLFAIPLAGWVIVMVLLRSLLSGVAYDRATDEVTGFEPAPLVGIGIVAVFLVLASIVGWLGAHHQLYGAHAQQPQTLGRSLATGVRRLPRTIGWGLLYVVGVIVAMVAVVLPIVALAVAVGPETLLVLLLVIPLAVVAGVWLAVKLAFSGTALAVGPSGTNPFSASWAISRQRWWAVFGRLVLLWVIIYGVSFIGQFVTQIGATLVPTELGFSIDSETGELLIDGEQLSEIQVIEVETFLPNPPVLILLLAFFLLTQAVSQALSVSGVAGLYYRGGGPAEL